MNGRAWSRPRRTCPDWCVSRNLNCRAEHGYPGAEHRAKPITISNPGAGSAVLTRVRTAGGTEYAEIRLSATLPADEHAARQRLAALLTHLRTLIGPAGR